MSTRPSQFPFRRRAALIGAAVGLPLALGGVAAIALADLPPVPQPSENQISEPKRVLGKILFFDEQLSTANTVSCATCHVMGHGGADPRLARNPGPDSLFNTPDDRLASSGVVSSNSSDNYTRDALFGVTPQVTPRAAPSPINAAYAPSLFWDGRATGQFTDPQTGQVAIVNGGALESQSVNPPVGTVEMAHAGIDWAQISTKLARVRPLDLATNLPPDVATALAGATGRVNYPELFRRAFGDTQISARRIAFAVATYERTLVSDQTPWDRFQAGDPNALTQGQIAGMGTFQQNCAVCHTPPFFTNQTFRNIGLRPPTEDLGRQNLTNNPADRGRFKVPSLRNIGLQSRFMHTGQLATITDVVRFYVRAPGAAPQFPDNIDPAVQAIRFPPQAEPALVDFVANALTDPRVANQQFPFDRPTLFTERGSDQTSQLGVGTSGTGGVVPRIIAEEPPMIGNQEFRIGLDGALGSAQASLVMSLNPPVSGQISPDATVGSVTIDGVGPNQGPATIHWALDPASVSAGQVIYMQWRIADPVAAGGIALSPILRIPVFCGSAGCPAPCGYANCDQSTIAPVLNLNDFICFQGRFAAGDPYANCDGSTTPPVLNVNDFICFLGQFAAGCH